MDIPKNLKYDNAYQPYKPYKPSGPIARPPDPSIRPTAGKPMPINDFLSPGEKVLWSGQPPKSLILFRPQDLALIPFFVFWTGFSLFWEAMALGAFVSDPGGLIGPGICFPLFGLPFVAIGVYMLFGRFILDAPARRRTYYALTDRRVLIVSGSRDRSVLSLPLDRIENVQLIVHRNGTGTLMFTGSQAFERSDGNGGKVYASGTGFNYGAPAFDHVESPKMVYDQLLKAQDDLVVRKHGYSPGGPTEPRR